MLAKTWGRSAIRWTARAAGGVLPLAWRKRLVASRLGRARRGGLEFALGMLGDLERQDAGAFHRFLWSNHLAYAATYEIEQRFGPGNLNPSRRMLLEDLTGYLRSRGEDPGKSVRSVLDVGCSMGYLLRHMEEYICPQAEVLHGFDIDGYAVETGTTHLATQASKVRLFAGDMADAERIVGGRKYDLILCCGVLMYVDEAGAYEAVRMMLARAQRLVAILSLADGVAGRPGARQPDGTFVHDVRGMIEQAGGQVVAWRPIGSDISGSRPADSILAEPFHQAERRARGE